MRSVWLVISLLGLATVQSPPAAGPNSHNALRSARSPEMTELLHKFDAARSREDEAELRRLATAFGEQARNNPNDAEAFYVAARTHNALLNLYVLRNQKDRARDQLDRAMERVNRAIELDGQRAEAFAIRAQLYGWKIGLTNGFLRAFAGMNYGGKIKENLDRALKLDPENPLVHVSMGMQDYYTPPAVGGSMERAANHFRRALQYDPENAEAWLWLGLALKAQKKNAEAKKAFETVLRFDPENTRAAREISPRK